MKWNYRLVCTDGFYEIKEVYYDEHMKIIGWCKANAGDDSVEEVGSNLELMRLAAEKPVLYLKQELKE